MTDRKDYYIVAAFAAFFLGFASLSIGAPAAAQQQYTYEIIDFPGANATHLHSIDDNGRIVGYHQVIDSSTGPFPGGGFFYQSGKFTPLDFPGADPFSTSPQAIADNRTVVGTYAEDQFPHAFKVTRKEKFNDYETIDCPGFIGAEATGINNRGDIVLNCVEELAPRQFFWHGFLLRDGTYTQIDFPGAIPTGIPNIGSGTFIRGITDDGIIVGAGVSVSGNTYVFQFSLTSDFGVTFTPFECPANVGITYTIAGVSSDGKIVGACWSPGIRNFLYSNGQFTILNDLPGAEQPSVRGVNKKGQIVGTFCESHCLPIRGFIGTPVKGKKTKEALVIN